MERQKQPDNRCKMNLKYTCWKLKYLKTAKHETIARGESDISTVILQFFF